MSRRSKLSTTPRLGLVAALLALLALLVGGCGSSDQRTIRLLSQLTATVDRSSPRADAVGSRLLLSTMLFGSGAGSAIGRGQASCIRTAPGSGEVYECQLTFILADGSLYAQAIASSQGPAAGVVTGGTGSYRQARGTFLYSATGNARVNLAFEIVTG